MTSLPSKIPLLFASHDGDRDLNLLAIDPQVGRGAVQEVGRIRAAHDAPSAPATR